MQAQHYKTKVRVTGKIQGVGFRANTKKLAQEMKLKGWVMNLGSGEVAMEVFGGRSTIKVFLERLKRLDVDECPAQVENIQSSWSLVSKIPFDDFVICYDPIKG